MFMPVAPASDMEWVRISIMPVNAHPPAITRPTISVAMRRCITRDIITPKRSVSPPFRRPAAGTAVARLGARRPPPAGRRIAGYRPIAER